MIDQVQLLECLRKLSDLDFQKRVWTGESVAEMSSFSELVCQTFDDTGLSDAQDEGCVSDELGTELSILIHDLDGSIVAVDSGLLPLDLIESPAMVQVRKLAGQICDALERLSELPSRRSKRG